MKVDRLHYQTFKDGSKTYFNSSLFFPQKIRRDVFILYGFVRVADNFVDSLPPDREGFYRFKNRYHRSLNGEQTGDPIIDSFTQLLRRKRFDEEWVSAFLHSMELDITKKEYDSLEETLEYIYGSAEVIGLFMAKILDLPERSYTFAQLLGRSMQYINFIRDIEEDLALGRRYLPLQGTPLKALNRKYAQKHLSQYMDFIDHHISLYRNWQKKAEEGFLYIPYRILIPIKTASDMYNWTAFQIHKDPLVVFEKKVKPNRLRIFLQVMKNTLGI